MRVVTSEQMRAADAAAVARAGDVALMRAAGAALAEAIARIAPQPRRLVAFAGPGNNGGDAYAAFAAVESRCEKVVYAMASAKEPSAGRRDAEERARVAGVVTRPFPATREDADAALRDCDVALDAMLGTGARVRAHVPASVPAPASASALVHAPAPALAHAHAQAPATDNGNDDPFAIAIAALNACSAHVLAVDVPTGAVRANTTVTLGAPKLELLQEPGRATAGTLYVGDIGIEAELAALDAPYYAALDDAEFRALLPVRGDESDKRISGAPLILAGSEQFPGAAVLCARGAARAGAGYVTLASGTAAAVTLRAHLVEEVVVTYDERDVSATIEALLDLTHRCNAVAIGPGLGLSDTMGAIVRGLIEKLDRPFVADASALFHLGKHLDILRGKTCVLTPHAGEFARLSGEGTIAAGTRAERLRAFVSRTGVTTLLKGAATLIDDGATIHVNVTGTNALATAGTGDVLSGIIATLLSQGLSPVDAARAGAYWHGLAGHHAAKQRPVGVIAGDVAESLGPALLSLDLRLAADGPRRCSRLGIES